MVSSPGPSTADIVADYCWRREAGEVHDLFGRILGQQHAGQQNREKTTTRPQTEEQRGKRACLCPHGQGSISKVMKGLVGGAAAGTAERRKQWTTALSSWSSGRGAHTPQTWSELKERAQIVAEAHKRQHAVL